MSEILGTLFKYLAMLLGVTAVVAVLYQVFSTNKTSTAMSEMQLLQSKVQSQYIGQPTFTSITPKIAIDGGFAPSNMIAAGGATLRNPWEGQVLINVNAANAMQFDITEAKVPREACSKWISSMTNIAGLKVNGSAVAMPVDAGDAVAACGLADNTIIFTFAH